MAAEVASGLQRQEFLYRLISKMHTELGFVLCLPSRAQSVMFHTDRNQRDERGKRSDAG